MRRILPAVAVALADVAIQAAGHRYGLGATVAYALAVLAVLWLADRVPAAALLAALALGWVVDGSYVARLWSAYRAGRGVPSRRGTAVVLGGAVGGLALQVAAALPGAGQIPRAVSAYAVFVALPLLVGRYLAQHDRLVSALHKHNRQLRRERDLLAEQERLRERLRIARDMHDSLGHRLGLVCVQAAALEVSEPENEALQRLAASARSAVDELHAVVGALRDGLDTGPPESGPDAIGALVAEFRAAGVPVTVEEHGSARPLPPGAGGAAYRVVEEGLTNATRHAPGQPVTVRLEWEPDALLLTVSNPAPDGRAGTSRAGNGRAGNGTGLTGLAERVGAADGYLDHRYDGGVFRLVAMLPAAVAAQEEPGPVRTFGLGLAAAVLMFGVLPAAMLLGAG